MRIALPSVLLAAFVLGGASCSSGNGGTVDAGGSVMDVTYPPVDAKAEEFLARNLHDINKYRATLGVAPLVLDTTLNAFAQTGSVLLSKDHTAHVHFNAALSDMSIWKDGFKSQAAENQGDPNGWLSANPDPTKSELDQIDAIQKTMFDEGPGAGEAHGHYTNMMDPKYTRLGVGLLEVDGKLYLTNDFSD